MSWVTTLGPSEGGVWPFLAPSAFFGFCLFQDVLSMVFAFFGGLILAATTQDSALIAFSLGPGSIPGHGNRKYLVPHTLYMGSKALLISA